MEIKKEQTNKTQLISEKCQTLINDYHTFALYAKAFTERAVQFFEDNGIFTLSVFDRPIKRVYYYTKAVPNSTYCANDIEVHWENFGDPFIELLNIYYEQLDVVKELFEESVRTFDPIAMNIALSLAEYQRHSITELTDCKKIIESKLDDGVKIIELRKLMNTW